MSKPKVVKVGGSSVATIERIKKVVSIIKSDPDRRVVVDSAPGKGHGKDHKITDLLYAYDSFQHEGKPYKGELGEVIKRFREIAKAFSVALPEGWDRDLYAAEGDFLVSRGEYLMARILAGALGFAFIDASEVIRFAENGEFDMEATRKNASRIKAAAEGGVVIPGFYGSLPDGSVKVFGRNSSDVSGAIIAAIVGASCYEIWSDQDGLCMADPRIVKNPRIIDQLSYEESHELAYMGAQMLHHDAVHPCQDAGIPIHIRNTFNLEHEGTRIVSRKTNSLALSPVVTGIAGRKGFTTISFAKRGMHKEKGFLHGVTEVLYKKFDVSIEHMPTGMDTMSVIISDDQLKGKIRKIVAALAIDCKVESAKVEESELALIAVVGLGMRERVGVLRRIAEALEDANVSVHTINQGGSEVTIVIGVKSADYQKAMQALYAEFAEE